MISSISVKSSDGKEPSRRLYNVSFDIENPVLRINKATKIAIIGSRILIPVIFN